MMASWMAGRLDGWRDSQIGGRLDGWMDGCMDGWLDRWLTDWLLIDWYVDCSEFYDGLINWLIDWLIDWMINWFVLIFFCPELLQCIRRFLTKHFMQKMSFTRRKLYIILEKHDTKWTLLNRNVSPSPMNLLLLSVTYHKYMTGWLTTDL